MQLILTALPRKRVLSALAYKGSRTRAPTRSDRRNVWVSRTCSYEIGSSKSMGVQNLPYADSAQIQLTRTAIPQTIRIVPANRLTFSPAGETFSIKTYRARPAIQSTFMTPA